MTKQINQKQKRQETGAKIKPNLNLKRASSRVKQSIHKF
jgi:hypothetical protein